MITHSACRDSLAWPPPCTARGWPCSRLLRIACSTVHTLSQPADRTTPPPSAAPQDCLPLGVGKGTHIKGAIVDKNARIGKFCKIVNAEGIQVRACVWMLVLLQGWAGSSSYVRGLGHPRSSGGGFGSLGAAPGRAGQLLHPGVFLPRSSFWRVMAAALRWPNSAARVCVRSEELLFAFPRCKAISGISRSAIARL